MKIRVAVVGAGIVGLAAADALQRAGATVQLFEKETPGQAQSAGLTRIFRCAHGDPRLVALAMQARDGWRDWERRLGRRLVGAEGLLVTGSDVVSRWEHAMRAAGAPCELITQAQARESLPIGRLPAGAALWDPSGGATRVRRTVEFLQAELAGSLVKAEVRELTAAGSGMRVRSSAGDWEGDQVLVAAGVDTPHLAAQVGLHMPLERVRSSRFTFAVRETRPERAPACWIDDSGAYGAGLSCYGQPVGSTGHYAVGVGPDGEGYPEALDAAEVTRCSLEVTRRYIRSALPDLDPTPLAEVQCLHNKMGNADGDGFGAERIGAVTIVYGNNLFKFAPLLGHLLSRAVLEGEVPAELHSPELVRSAI
ncbi:MAG TPA: FAD-dependent oxidoreductase [Chloroflexota bacterium]|nr:FAD-dependent oxidoreductase [Chloroflexota bacterium]